MIKYTNAALYNVDLEGEDYGEFGGEHPTLVLRTKMEKEMYIAIPFTTYTEARWEKFKKYMCCRVKSTDSIARIDKIEIITVDKIKNRWREGKKLLIPSREDLETVINKALAYFQASFLVGISEYVSTDQAVSALREEFNEVIVNENISQNELIHIDFSNQDYMRVAINACSIKQLSIQELYDMMNCAFTRAKYKVSFERNCINFDVPLEDKKALTLKEKYDNLNSTEG